MLCYVEEKVRMEDNIGISMDHECHASRGASRMTSPLGKIVIFGISIASVSVDCRFVCSTRTVVIAITRMLSDSYKQCGT